MKFKTKRCVMLKSERPRSPRRFEESCGRLGCVVIVGRLGRRFSVGLMLVAAAKSSGFSGGKSPLKKSNADCPTKALALTGERTEICGSKDEALSMDFAHW